METSELLAMMLNEAGFMTGISITDLAEYVTFMLPGHIGTTTSGKFIINGTKVRCNQENCIDIDLCDPTSLLKIVQMASRCLARQSMGQFDVCGHCPFKKRDNASAMASFQRHNKNREDIY